MSPMDGLGVLALSSLIPPIMPKLQSVSIPMIYPAATLLTHLDSQIHWLFVWWASSRAVLCEI